VDDLLVVPGKPEKPDQKPEKAGQKPDPGKSIATNTSRPRVYRSEGSGFATDRTRTRTVFHRNFTTNSWITTTATIANIAKKTEPEEPGEETKLSEPLTIAE